MSENKMNIEKTILVLFDNGNDCEFPYRMLKALRHDKHVLEIMDGETGDIIYVK